jgi:hypothetical protein
MDYINKAIGSHHPGGQQQPPQGQQAQPSGSGNLMGRLQGMAGGGPQGEKHEDALDKGAFFPISISLQVAPPPQCPRT